MSRIRKCGCQMSRNPCYVTLRAKKRKIMLTGSFILFQCRPSKGRKRGYCWCVDKYGQPLPGYDGKGKGDVHCYNLESKWRLGASSSGICAWPLDLAETLEGLGKHCGLCCAWSNKRCLLRRMESRSLCGRCCSCTLPLTCVGLPIGRVGSSEFPRKPALLIPRGRGTSGWIQGVSTDFLNNGLWPIWSRKILVFYFKEFIDCKLVKVLKKTKQNKIKKTHKDLKVKLFLQVWRETYLHG